MGKINANFHIVLTMLIFSIFSTGGCRADSSVSDGNFDANGENPTVSAAVSLRDAFGEIGALYKSKTGRTVNFNFGASGALQRQIETGAPVDVFAGAGEKQMNELAGKNLIDVGTRRNFARNTLVLIVPSDSKAALADFTDLTKPEFKKIAAGNPKTVPAGQYTEQVFENLNLKSAVQSKLILAEDVRQVLDYVARGEADAGIVYASDALAAKEKVKVIAQIPEKLHAPIFYPVAVVKDSQNKRAAQEFVDLIFTPEGRQILQKYGFLAANAEK